MGGRGAAAVAVSIGTVLVLGACGGGEDGTDASGAATPPASSTDSPTASPTEPLVEPEPTPVVEPASGPRLAVSGIRINVPKGWQQTFSSVVVDTALGRVDGMSGGVLLSVAPTGGDVLTPEKAERYFWTHGRKPKTYEKQDDVLMGGLTSRYYTERTRFYDIHVVTLWEDNLVTKVEVRFDPKVPGEVQQELFQSIIASYSSPRMRL